MKKAITFDSYAFGCRVNQAEKIALDRALLKNGFLQMQERPDLYIINTCAITQKAEKEARKLINHIKKTYPATKIIITGCSATYWLKNNIKINNVDEIIDNTQKEYLAKLIYKKFNNNHIISYSDSIQQNKYLQSKRMMIKIQDGCHRYCSYCIVPYLRGLPQSYTIKEILANIKNLEKTINEVVLTAINTEAYGYDTKESFTNLIQKILEKTSIKRLSFGSVHPWSLDEDFFNLYKKESQNPRLIDFFHIPLQSGADKVLNLMKRNYCAKEIIEKINELTKINPFLFIGTDIIVGFPEETKEDFETTYNILKNAPIHKFHVFRYSNRKNTAAYYMSKRLKQLPEEEKINRSKKLIALGKQKYIEFLNKHVKGSFSAMFLDQKKGNHQTALLQNQIPVFIKNSKIEPGTIKKVMVTDLKNNQLTGISA